MHRRLSALAALFIVLASLTVASCGSDGATNPGPNRDRLEITFGYAAPGRPGFLIAAMDLYQITKDGRLATPFIASAGIDEFPQWSNDGTKLLFSSNGPNDFGKSIWVANADGSGLRQLVVDSNGLVNDNDQDRGSWSPGGDSIVFQRTIRSTPDQGGIAMMSADGSGVRWLVPGGNWPSWSVTNRIAFSKGGSLWTINPDGSGLQRVTSVAAGEYDGLPQWSRDGSKLVFIHTVPANNPYGQDMDVVTIRADGTDRRTLVANSINENPSWSADGKYVLYERTDTSDPAPNHAKCALYKISADGGASVNLTPNRGYGLCGGSSWRPM